MENLTLSNRVSRLSLSATIEMQAKAKELKDQGVSVISLGTGEPDFETPQVIIDAAKKAMDAGANHYTPVRGTDELVGAMRMKFARDQKVEYAKEQVLSTLGAKAAIVLALQAVAEEGDEVIVLSPYWVSYPEQVKLVGAKPVIVTATASENFLPSPQKIRDAITPRTKAIIINSPNNPSGMVFDESLLKEIMSIFEGTSVWVISDEIYEHLLFDQRKHVSPASFSADAYARTLVVSGASKNYAMTGWRVGIVGGPLKLVQAMVKLQQQFYSCITSVAQSAAAYAFSEPPELKKEIELMRSSYEERRDLVQEKLTMLKDVDCVSPQGAFYAFLDFSKWIGKEHRGTVIKDDMELALRLLAEAHVALVAGSAFGAPGCLRFSIASSKENIEEGIRRISNWLS